MRNFLAMLSLTFLVMACSEILRKPNFELQSVTNPEAEVRYKVKGFEATPEIIARSNKDPFVRYVTLGGDTQGPSRRVEERELFSGPKPPANKRQAYKIGVGDTISVSRSGYDITTNGIETRQVFNQSYLVKENGSVDLQEGKTVFLEGMTVEQAQEAIESTFLFDGGSNSERENLKEFPRARPTEYKLGLGDLIRVSRLVETTNADGVLEQTVQSSTSKVGTDGVISVLQLGEIEALGLTLGEVRDRVLREAIRNGGGIDTVVEIEGFNSQSALVLGDLGTHTIPLSDRPETYDLALAGLQPSFSNNRDFDLKLERDGATYHMNAKLMLSGQNSGEFFIFDGDRLTITERLPDSDVQVHVTNFGSRKLTYLRVTENDAALSQQGTTISVDVRGIDLRGLLIGQGIDVTQNEDLIVKINRRDRTFIVSAQEAVLTNPQTRYWLAPDDHIVVEDIAYVGDDALLVGEIGFPRKLSVNRHSRTKLSAALFDSGVFNNADADFRHVYVLRGSELDFVAYHFDLSEVLSLSLTEKFELRPGDIMFVRTRPLSRYSRALSLALNFVNAVDAGITNSRTFGR